MANIPKGEELDDHIEIVRKATDTRPINLKNTDNKIVAKALNISITPALMSQACELQNGFVRGRQLGQNSLDLDTHSRITAMAHQQETKDCNMLSI